MIDNEKTIEVVQIADMYLAAAVMSYGAELLGIDRTDPRKQKFSFKNTIEKVYLLKDGLVQTVEKPSFADLERYSFNRVLMGHPAYADALKKVKSALHSV